MLHVAYSAVCYLAAQLQVNHLKMFEDCDAELVSMSEIQGSKIAVEWLVDLQSNLLRHLCKILKVVPAIAIATQLTVFDGLRCRLPSRGLLRGVQ